MYRILDSTNSSRERRNQLTRAHYHKPELVVRQPNQVLSWDITRLKGPEKWPFYYLYVILDIFSRFTAGWMLAHIDRGRNDSSMAFPVPRNCQLRFGSIRP